MVEPSEKVMALAAGGRKVEAIKQLRTETGLGLKEAKEIVDGIEVDERSVPAAGREESSGGRLLLTLAVLLGGLGLFYFLSGGD